MSEMVTLIGTLKEEVSAKDAEGIDEMLDKICDMLVKGELGREDAWKMHGGQCSRTNTAQKCQQIEEKLKHKDSK